MMARNTVPPPVDPALPLAERTRELVARFDAEEKDPGFKDSGDGTGYAEWFADLLERMAGADNAVTNLTRRNAGRRLRELPYPHR